MMKRKRITAIFLAVCLIADHSGLARFRQKAPIPGRRTEAAPTASRFIGQSGYGFGGLCPESR